MLHRMFSLRNYISLYSTICDFTPSSPLPPPVTYRGPHNAAAILAFIASALPPATRPSPSVVSSLVKATGDGTFERVRAVFRRQREEEVKKGAAAGRILGKAWGKAKRLGGDAGTTTARLNTKDAKIAKI